MINDLYPVPDWQLLIQSKRPVIFDVGCNDGGHSRIFQHLFPECMIHAFEPDSRAIEHCKKRIALGQIDLARFQLFEGVLSDVQGTLEFWPSSGHVENAVWYESGWDLSGSTLKPVANKHPFVEGIIFESPVLVRSTTLDNYVEESAIQEIDLLWMDVQGAEFNVLKGSVNNLNKISYIYLECEASVVYEGQPTLHTITKFLQNYSFKRIANYPDGNYLFASEKSLSTLIR